MDQTALATENNTAQKPPNAILLAGSALGVVFGDIGTSPLYTLKTVILLSGSSPTARHYSRSAVADYLDAAPRHVDKIRGLRDAF